jgi:hypothetical protein
MASSRTGRPVPQPRGYSLGLRLHLGLHDRPVPACGPAALAPPRMNRVMERWFEALRHEETIGDAYRIATPNIHCLTSTDDGYDVSPGRLFNRNQPR